MTDTTAAPAPVTDEVATDEVTTQEAVTPEIESEDDMLDAAFDRISADEPPIELKEPEPEPEQAEAAPQAPTDLPGEIKDAWADIPENIRDVVAQSHRNMSQKNADMGRQVQATKPVYDVLLQAAKDIPELASMTPDKIGQEVFALAKINAQIRTNPMAAVMGFVQKYNLGPQMAQAMGQQGSGQNVIALQNEVTTLKQELAKAADPAHLRQAYQQFSTEQQTVQSVEQFAASAEHWADVEPLIPAYIEPARASLAENASEKDVLSKAYDLAVYAKGIVAKAKDGDEPSPQPDPEKAEAVKRATSVNMKGTVTGNPRTLSEDEALSAAFDRASSA
ncbi:hypothetical protein JQV19_08435 [Sulfitobacter mediterraneus]|uniref:hypothetical protein n=1 Tax=Sulfitobacter mediterraneus TaxID=83219 RepID=UPI001939AA6F|nr:hypothetical protein [Sulfitobacter mediterraneus]MBM1556673.1 hypothetical protein [Sulfitobacter mediterraneus]MBM1570130.1 hypothetical protein [Sulfitobacter mediterraneus]MBM1574087.1 hypothetical protein [Sulfitobacter mediterraneus]MBM1577872.1 hypothetical protein [Sulfitobacter mediterraneus]MBM1579631.1 hypothetical protein [Sulfitobacter mediterraneus]